MAGLSQNNVMSLAALMSGQNSAIGALKPQYDLARGDLTSQDNFKPFYDSGVSADKMRLDALGVNGSDAARAARSAFQNSSPYQFELDQGLDAINRTAASRGMLASGNNSMDLTKYSQGLANQRFGDWINNLGTVAGQGVTSAAGRQDLQKSLSGLDYGYGSDQAGIYTGMASKMADVFGQADKRQSSSSNTLSAILGGANLAAGALSGYFKGGSA